MSTYSQLDPEMVAANVLRTYWDGSLPVKIDQIAQQMGARLIPEVSVQYSGYYIAANDATNQTGVPLIKFNATDPINRRRFTVAHELGHFALAHGTSPRDNSEVFSSGARNPSERAANQFAAGLLMPANAVRQLVAQGYGGVENLAGIFGVSTAAMGYRLINLGIRL